MCRYFLLFLVLTVYYANAQTQMSLGDAVKICLENNYSIQIAKNEVRIVENNVSYGNAGFLPSIDASARHNNSVNKVSQEFMSGEKIQRPDAKSSSLGAGVSLNWTLFDGFYMFINYDRLKEYQKLGEINLIVQVENTLSRLFELYYEIIYQNNFRSVLLEGISLSQERYDIINSKYELGFASRLELLQASVDINAAQAAIIKQEMLIKNLKVFLAELLLIDKNQDFVLTTEIDNIQKPDFQEYYQKMLESNSLLQSARVQKNISELSISSIKSQYYPRLNVFANYDYSKTESESGFIKFNTNRGYSYGVNLSFNIFNGLNTNRELENAEIMLKNINLGYSELQNQLESNYLNAHNSHLQNLEIIELEISNLEVAQENLEIALQRYEIGKSNYIEYREAQKSYLDSKNRLIAAKYNAKVTEKEIFRLAGSLYLLFD